MIGHIILIINATKFGKLHWPAAHLPVRRRVSTVWGEARDGNPRHGAGPWSALMRDERGPLGAALGR